MNYGPSGFETYGSSAVIIKSVKLIYPKTDVDRRRRAKLLLLIIAILAFIGAWCEAGTPHEKALAAMSVARARLQVADDKAVLPDSSNRFSTVPETVPPRQESPVPNPAQEVPVAESAPVYRPLEARFEPFAPIQSSGQRKLKAYFYTGERAYGKGWCVNCPEAKRTFRSNDDLDVIWSDDKANGPQQYPAARFFGPDGIEYMPSDAAKNYTRPTSMDGLASYMRRYGMGSDHESYSASGPAGTFHASDKIDQVKAYMRRYVGEGNEVAVIWNHSEGKLNLLAAKDWEPKDLIGTNGRLEVDIPKAIGLPVKSMAVNYRIIGRGMQLAAEPFTVDGLLDNLKPQQASFGAQPVGFFVLDDMLEIYWIVSMFHDLFAVLHPSADLILPDEISLNAVLNGETITVKCDKPPSVCLKWLFTFSLAIKTVTITNSNIHVEFSGSRWIKSRDFAVQ